MKKSAQRFLFALLLLTPVYSFAPPYVHLSIHEIEAEEMALGRQWEALKPAFINALAELDAFYSDATLVFLARDAEYLYDLAQLLLDRNRSRLLNVSTRSSKADNLEEYLAQEGLTKESLARKDAVLIDTGFYGRIPKAIRKILGEPRELSIHMLESVVPTISQTRVFQRTFEQAGGPNTSTAVQWMEGLPHFTDPASHYEKRGDRWVPMTARQDDEPLPAPDRSVQRMKDLKVFAARNREEFERVRSAMATLVAVARRQSKPQEEIDEANAVLNARGIQRAFELDLGDWRAKRTALPNQPVHRGLFSLDCAAFSKLADR